MSEDQNSHLVTNPNTPLPLSASGWRPPPSSGTAYFVNTHPTITKGKQRTAPQSHSHDHSSSPRVLHPNQYPCLRTRPITYPSSSSPASSRG